MKKLYGILDLLILLALIFWNYYSNTGAVSDNTVGSLSAEYDNLFTPAGYAFSIWGIIYLWLLAHCIFKLIRAFGKSLDDAFIRQIGPLFAVVNILNGVWLWFWLNEDTGLSLLTMAGILVSLLSIVVLLGIGRRQESAAVKGWVWWPMALYSGWITVATVANVSAYLAKIGWEGWGLSELTWAVVMVAVAAVVNLAVVFSRGMSVFGFVGVWALVAIAVRHWGEIPTLQWAALISALVILAGIVVQFLGYRKKMRLAA